MKTSTILKLIFYPIALAIILAGVYLTHQGLYDLFSFAAEQWVAPLDDIFTAALLIVLFGVPLMQFGLKLFYIARDETREIDKQRDFLIRMREITCLPFRDIDSTTTRSGHFVQVGSSWRDHKTNQIMIVDRIVYNNQCAFVAFKGSLRIYPIDFLNGKRFIEVTQADYAKTFKDLISDNYVYEPGKPF